MPPPRIYLAGPEVFLPDAQAMGARKAALCAAHGLEGVFPLDAQLNLATREVALVTQSPESGALELRRHAPP